MSQPQPVGPRHHVATTRVATTLSTRHAHRGSLSVASLLLVLVLGGCLQPNESGSADDSAASGLAMLTGSTIANELGDAILDAFDREVAEGDLAGSGTGRLAARRLGAFRNMLVDADQLLESGDPAAACRQLAAAQRRLRGGGGILESRLVVGSGAERLEVLMREGIDC
jgi:hypothetical protein